MISGSYVYFVTGMVICSLCRLSLAFDAGQLSRMQERYRIWQRGHYACAVTRAVFDQRSEPPPYVAVSLYFVAPGSYDRVMYVVAAPPIDVRETEHAVSLTWEDSNKHQEVRLLIGQEGVRYHIRREWPNGGGGVFCHLMLDAVRFDGATAYEPRGSVVARYQLLPDRPELSSHVVSDPELPDIAFTNDDGFHPTWVIKTEEGLTTYWEVEVGQQGVRNLYSPACALLGIGEGSEAYRLFNAANGVAPGGWVECVIRTRWEPSADYPRPPERAARLRLFDSHVHLAVDTDVRDSVRMARKHGFRYGLLSILLDEGPYRRRFEGNAPVLAVAKRYPDVFVPFGLVQLNPEGYPGFPRHGPDAPSDLRAMWRAGFRGLKTLEKWSTVEVDSADFDPLYREAAQLGMPIVFHTNPEGSGCSCSRVANVARKFPRLNVIMAHLYDAHQFWQVLPELASLPNLYIQHMHLDQVRVEGQKTALEVLIQRGLAEKIVYGSDIQIDHSVELAAFHRFRRRLRALGVDEPTQDAILWKTMTRIVPAQSQTAAPE